MVLTPRPSTCCTQSGAARYDARDCYLSAGPGPFRLAIPGPPRRRYFPLLVRPQTPTSPCRRSVFPFPFPRRFVSSPLPCLAKPLPGPRLRSSIRQPVSAGLPSATRLAPLSGPAARTRNAPGPPERNRTTPLISVLLTSRSLFSSVPGASSCPSSLLRILLSAAAPSLFRPQPASQSASQAQRRPRRPKSRPSTTRRRQVVLEGRFGLSSAQPTLTFFSTTHRLFLSLDTDHSCSNCSHSFTTPSSASTGLHHRIALASTWSN